MQFDDVHFAQMMEQESMAGLDPAGSAFAQAYASVKRGKIGNGAIFDTENNPALTLVFDPVMADTIAENARAEMVATIEKLEKARLDAFTDAVTSMRGSSGLRGLYKFLGYCHGILPMNEQEQAILAQLRDGVSYEMDDKTIPNRLMRVVMDIETHHGRDPYWIISDSIPTEYRGGCDEAPSKDATPSKKSKAARDPRYLRKNNPSYQQLTNNGKGRRY